MRKKITTLEELAVIIKDGFDMMNGHFDKIGKKRKNRINKSKKIKKNVI
jgi:hypothetical protein